MACFFTRISSTRCFRCMSGCANTGAILNRLNASHGQTLTANGGSGFLRNTGGTGFWHELYSARGGFEAIYTDVQRPIGFLRFAKTVPAKGSVFSARERVQRDNQHTAPPFPRLRRPRHATQRVI